MAIEDLISKMTVAIEANTAAILKVGGGAAAKPSATTTATTTTKPAATGIEFDAIKIAGNKVVEAKGRPFVKKLIKDVGGAADLASVKKEKYAALMKAFDAALAPEEAEAEAEAEEDTEL